MHGNGAAPTAGARRSNRRRKPGTRTAIEFMKDTLFDIPESESPRLKWMKRVKSELQIFTHFCKDGKWLAFSQSKAIEFLAGYDLTESQKAEPIELFAGYCRLLEESGQLADGEETEEDAIIKVATFHGQRLWNEL